MAGQLQHKRQLLRSLRAGTVRCIGTDVLLLLVQFETRLSVKEGPPFWGPNVSMQSSNIHHQ
eukprot:2154644-Amphidinium_carterae.1